MVARKTPEMAVAWRWRAVAVAVGGNGFGDGRKLEIGRAHV